MPIDEPVMFQGKWIESSEDSEMVQQWSAKACQAALPLSGRLSRSVTTQLKRVKPQHHDLLKHIAGHLYLSEFLDNTALVCSGSRSHSKKAQREFLNQQVDEAVADLRDAGIIPIAPTWFSLAWFVFKWVIVPFIRQVLYDYNDVKNDD